MQGPYNINTISECAFSGFELSSHEQNIVGDLIHISKLLYWLFCVKQIPN